METKPTEATNVIRFPGPRAARFGHGDQRSLMDAVYSAGSLPISADDRATKMMATRLHIFGFVVIDEIQRNGTARRLRPSETVHASSAHPWRVSKPASRYAVAALPETDEDLFSAKPA